MSAAFAALTVPIDASAQGRHGVDVALRIARTGTRVHFCSVVETLAACVGAPGALVDPLPLIDALEDAAKRICADAVAAAEQHGVAADGKVLFGAPAAEIVRFAHDTDSDGIVICTHARSGLARALAGSVAESVLAASDLPVIVVHAGDDVAAAGPVTVAVDGSPASGPALQTAIRIAQAREQTISVVHVVEPGAPWAEAAAMLNEAAETARAANIDFELVTLRGHAAQTIVESARRRGSPMIVMGTHGRSGVARALLGSVAAAVIEHANVPVTVVRRS